MFSKQKIFQRAKHMTLLIKKTEIHNNFIKFLPKKYKMSKKVLCYISPKKFL